MLVLYSEIWKITKKLLIIRNKKNPELAAAVTKIAYRQALASGSSVLISENGDSHHQRPDK